MEFPKSPVYAFANDDELVQTEKYVGKEIFGEEFVLEGEDELFLSSENAYRYFKETKGRLPCFWRGFVEKNNVRTCCFSVNDGTRCFHALFQYMIY